MQISTTAPCVSFDPQKMKKNLGKEPGTDLCSTGLLLNIWTRGPLVWPFHQRKRWSLWPGLLAWWSPRRTPSCSPHVLSTQREITRFREVCEGVSAWCCWLYVVAWCWSRGSLDKATLGAPCCTGQSPSSVCLVIERLGRMLRGLAERTWKGKTWSRDDGEGKPCWRMQT